MVRISDVRLQHLLDLFGKHHCCWPLLAALCDGTYHQCTVAQAQHTPSAAAAPWPKVVYIIVCHSNPSTTQ